MADYALDVADANAIFNEHVLGTIEQIERRYRLKVVEAVAREGLLLVVATCPPLRHLGKILAPCLNILVGVDSEGDDAIVCV